MKITIKGENINPNLTFTIHGQFDSFMNEIIVIKADSVRIELSEKDIEMIAEKARYIKQV